MVGKLFSGQPPTATSRVLDPGCGEGEFIAGIIRACEANQWPIPHILGIDLDERHVATARERFRMVREVDIVGADFLTPMHGSFDYIIGNPPYVSILQLDPEERQRYREGYSTATGRFDLYLLFFEQALRVLGEGGRLVFITPEKFLYTESARALRTLMSKVMVAELHFMPEGTFVGRVTYPLITTIEKRPAAVASRVIRRDEIQSMSQLGTGDSWLPAIHGVPYRPHGMTLADACVRVSCGVATGADGVFVLADAQVPPALLPFSYPTISGRQIAPDRTLAIRSRMLAPYSASGRLLSTDELGALGEYLGEARRREVLESRVCTRNKAWYAFHDSFPIADIRRPKILCKDVAESPFFVEDSGGLVPRHSVYYIVPRAAENIDPLLEYLNSPEATAWLRAHCQRAARSFLRIQSHVLKRLPIPPGLFAEGYLSRDDALPSLDLLPA